MSFKASIKPGIAKSTWNGERTENSTISFCPKTIDLLDKMATEYGMKRPELLEYLVQQESELGLYFRTCKGSTLGIKLKGRVQIERRGIPNSIPR